MSETFVMSPRADAPATGNPDRPRGRHRFRRLFAERPMLVAVIALVFGSVLISAVHVRFYTALSPIDELQHIDYLYKAPHIVRNGEKVGQDAMREEACRTLPNFPDIPDCSDTATYDPDDFQEDGTNTAAIYTPLYYTITKAIALPLQWLTGLDSLVTAARLVGGLWLAGGLVMTLLVARRFGAHPYPTAGLLLAAAATPNVLLPAATITPDAAAVLAGASLLWSVLWWEDRPGVRRLWLPTILSLAVVSLKALNILIVVMVALYLLLRLAQRRWWPNDEPGEERRSRDHGGPTTAQSLGLITAIAVVAIAGAFGYILFSSASAIASSDGVAMAQRVRADSFPLTQLFEHIGAFLQVFYNAGWWVTVAGLGPAVQSVVSLTVTSGTFAAVFVSDGLSRKTRTAAFSLLVVGLVGAPLIITFSYLSQGMFVPIPGRYALTLVPVGLAVAAAALHRRSTQIAIGASGLAMYLAMIGWMLAV